MHASQTRTSTGPETSPRRRQSPHPKPDWRGLFLEPYYLDPQLRREIAEEQADEPAPTYRRSSRGH